jgi:hypothetical protein
LHPPPLQQGNDAAEQHLQQPFQFGQQPAQPDFDAVEPVVPAVQQLLNLAAGQPLLPPGPLLAFAVLGDSDSSSEDDMTHAAAAELRFIKGDATLGDARHFCGEILKRFRTSTRMQGWNITQHAYAISAYCDDVTRTAIEDTIAVRREGKCCRC